MVMRLPPPTICSIQLVQEVVNERSNGVNADYFAQICQEWQGRVQEYIDHEGSPESVRRWPAISGARKTSFLNLYLAPAMDSVQGRMLAALRAHELNICPACGEMGKPNTLDHYLPKGIYPHFCITPLNLFPMCDSCQKEKLEKTGTLAEPRFFLHPYFDVFIVEQVLHVVISPPYSAPAFDLIISEHLNAGQRALVASHIRELSIAQRFSHFFKNENMRTLRLVSSMRHAGLPVEPMLRSFAESRQLPSLNSWEHIYYNAVINNGEMLDYLSNGELPPNV